MPLLRDLGNLSNLLSDSLVSKSAIWKREASAVTQLDFAIFLAQHRDNHYAQALREIDLVITAGIEALICGELEHADFVLYEYPKAAFTSSELVEWLSCVSLARRRAIMFALEMKMHPRDVIGIEWGTLSQLKMTPLAFEIVCTSMRHFKLKYVFWDFLSNGAAAPLFGLAESALEVSQGLEFETLLNLYDKMVFIDSEADLESFKLAFNIEGNKGQNRAI